MRIVVIGNGPAAMSAIKAIAAHKAMLSGSKADVTIISAETCQAYSPMFLVDYLTGALQLDQILLRESYGLACRRLQGEKATRVCDERNSVILENGKEIEYDRLLIVSGASPIVPAIRGVEKEGVFFLNRLDDAERLSRRIRIATKVIAIGAGMVGVEAAIAFRKMGRNVSVIEAVDHILPQMLDKELADRAEKKLCSLGIQFMLGAKASEIVGSKVSTGVVVGDKEIEGDLILVATGVMPNVDFLERSNVTINKGIIVDEKMRTTVPNIYAAGDVAESIDPYGGREILPNWYNSAEQGWIAGCNLIGLDITCPYSPPVSVLKGAEPAVVAVGRVYGDADYEILSYRDTCRGIYEKMFLRDERMDAYQAIGMVDKVGLMYNYIRGRKDLRVIKEELNRSVFGATLMCH